VLAASLRRSVELSQRLDRAPWAIRPRRSNDTEQPTAVVTIATGGIFLSEDSQAVVPGEHAWDLYHRD
jgi:hypothetical protein